MTIINVNTLEGRFTIDEKRMLAEKLTDAVMIPEIGQFVAAARVGFQVTFTEFKSENMVVSGKLLSDLDPMPDNINVHVLVMDGDWTVPVRQAVIENIAKALAEVSGLPEPLNSWKSTFQVIDEGSFGTGAGVLSILDLLNSGVFSEEKRQAVINHINH